MHYIHYMAVHRQNRQVTARLPGALAEALEQRADELGTTPSAVVREALAREVSTPVDPRSRSYVAVWLEAQEVEV